MNRNVKKIAVHCSDSDDSLDIGVKQIRKWHVDLPPNGNGWSDIGYHFVIRRDGRIEKGRDMDTVGAHVKGHNSDSIGICLVGRKVFSTEQLLNLYQLLRGLIDKYNLETTDVYGHYELDPNKTCPNMPMDFIRFQTLFTPIGLNVEEL